MKIHKYFYYLKIKKNYMTEQHLDILDLTLNKIFNKIIKKHQGSRIIVHSEWWDRFKISIIKIGGTKA